MDEQKYIHITFYTTIIFAKELTCHNQHMGFFYVSGVYTHSSENEKIMWASVKDKTENVLNNIHFKAVYSFRPGFIMPLKTQNNVRLIYKGLKLIYPIIFPNNTLTYDEIVTALIQIMTVGYNKNILEIKDLKLLAKPI